MGGEHPQPNFLTNLLHRKVSSSSELLMKGRTRGRPSHGTDQKDFSCAHLCLGLGQQNQVLKQTASEQLETNVVPADRIFGVASFSVMFYIKKRIEVNES